MARLPYFRCWALVFFLLATGSAPAQSPDLNAANLWCGVAPSRLRWHNVEGPPFWHGGCPPTYLRSVGQHVMTLSPGHRTSIHLPSGSVLRVNPVDNPFENGDLEIWVSNGTDLARQELRAVFNPDGSYLITGNPHQAQLISIERPAASRCSLRLACFVSRREAIPYDAPSSCQLIGCGVAQPLSMDGCDTGDEFYRIESHRPFQLNSSRGPTQCWSVLRCDLRMIYDPLELRNAQSFQVELQAATCGDQSCSVETVRDTRHCFTYCGKHMRLSSSETVYLAVPPGTASVTLTTTADALIQVKLYEAPTAVPPAACSPTPIWNIRRESILDTLRAGHTNWPAQWNLALRSARDNEYRDGGITAWRWLEQLALARSGSPLLQRAAERIETSYTYFEALTPDTIEGSNLSLHHAWFTIPRLVEPGDRPRPHQLERADLVSALGNVQEGLFVEVAPGRTVAYQLPQTNVASHLRLSVDRSQTPSCGEISIRLRPAAGARPGDNQSTSSYVRLRLESRSRQAAGLLELSRAATALRCLPQHHVAWMRGTEGPEFAQVANVGPLLRVAVSDLNIDTGTRWVELTNHSDATLRWCLHQRRSSTHRLTESEYRYLSSQETRAVSMADRLWPRRPPEAESFDDVRSELDNFFVPLRRHIEDQSRLFHDNLVTLNLAQELDAAGTNDVLPTRELTTANLGQESPSSKPSTATSLALVDAIDESAPPHERLRSLSELIDSASGTLRSEAIVARVALLDELDESYLAENELRGRLTQDPDPQVRRVALDLLLARYSNAHDTAKYDQAIAAAVHRDPTADRLRMLAHALAARDEWSLCLLAHLVQGPQIVPDASVRAASYHERWGRLYEESVAAIGTPTSSPNEAEAIRRQLESPQLNERLEGIRAWERWSAEHPGPYLWQNAPQLVRACVATERLVVDDRDAGDVGFRAEPGRPSRVVVQGPAVIRIRARLIHPQTAHASLQDWLVIRGEGRDWIWPFIDNQLADVLRLRSDRGIPGHEEQLVIQVGPGRHHLSIGAEKYGVVFRIERQVPWLWQTGLPYLTPRAIDQALAGIDDAQLASDPTMHALIALRLGTLDQAMAQQVIHSTNPNAIQPDPALLDEFAARAGDSLWKDHTRVGNPTGADPRDVYPSVKQLLEFRATNAWERRQAAAFLLRTIPHFNQPSEDRLRQQVLFALVQLEQSDDADPVIRRFRRVLSQQGRWVVFREVATSAGIVRVQENRPRTSGHNGLTRFLVANRSAQPEPDFILSGDSVLQMGIEAREAVAWDVTLRQPQVAFEPQPDSHIEVRTNGVLQSTLLLAGNHRTLSFRIQTPKGQQNLELRLVDPYAGQQVWVNLQPSSNPEAIAQLRTARDAAQSTRSYHVATNDTPVQLHIIGPAWMRVERQTSSSFRTQDVVVADGTRTLTLTPPATDQRMLVRVTEFHFDATANPLPTYRLASVAGPRRDTWLPPGEFAYAQSAIQGGTRPSIESLALQSVDAPPHVIPSSDVFPLLHQEDGTWGFAFGATQRRALEEGIFGAGQDRFLPLSLSYEERDEYRDIYRRAEGVFRLREESGPSMGMRYDSWQSLLGFLQQDHHERIDRPCSCSIWDQVMLHQQYSGYVQRPSDALDFYHQKTEGSLGFRTQLYLPMEIQDAWRHLPSVTLLGRWLSLDQTSYVPGRVDQDIFTPFKNTHRLAFYLSDTLTYEATETCEIWTRPALFTNEDLNVFRPDHILVQTGISRLLGDTSLTFAHRYARFFDDGDRGQDVDQHLLYLGATFDRWQHAGSQHEVDLDVRHDLGAGETSVYLTLTWFRSAGRGYQDHHASRVAFRQARWRRVEPRWVQQEEMGAF